MTDTSFIKILKDMCDNPDTDPEIKVQVMRSDQFPTFSTNFDEPPNERIIDVHTIAEIRQYRTMGKRPIYNKQFSKGFLKWVKTAKILY